MPYKLKINQQNLAPGAEVQIGGLGVFENGKVYKISDDQARAFQVHHGRVVAGEDGKSVYELGPKITEVKIHGVQAEVLQHQEGGQ